MSKHYFIGISIPLPVAKKLDDKRKEWNLKSHKRYTPFVDMHITLLFIGNDPNGEIEAVAKALETVKQAPFELVINGVETFGNPKTPRIIYASLQESEELNRLHEQIQQTVLPYHLSPDTKRFVPHITLAGKWAGGPPISGELEIEPLSFSVNEFSLFEIHPREVPRYIPIATYPLTEGV
ncbi:RNA 2',3'-cyclic phosphodiesterase [Planococcus salinus]|uniref:RNA 2',3'-cyclic phosphodiesterase n=1 Tax=Planococcus salinus TaxID=1848460 RepID=A0A3M8PAQ0_9BACL|nr:RNA 2',3'-cyclic phosphodiesterase [Planococcus salinus]RNF40795.1 RNA 2',3'-cyclic phosphodiesterase [Planococcus salinus]